MKFFPVWCLLFGLFLFGGCAIYTFNPGGKADFSTIAVEPFENQTPEFGLADRLTEIVIDAFIADGMLKVVGRDQAEVVLKGILKKYERISYQFDENDQVQKYKVLMDFEIVLINTGDETERWRQAMTQEGIFDANDETEEDGQTRAGERLVEAILNKTTKSW